MKVDDAPLAVTSRGSVILNATHVFGLRAAHELLALLDPEATVYIGVIVDADAADRILASIEPGIREAAALEAGQILWK